MRKLKSTILLTICLSFTGLILSCNSNVKNYSSSEVINKEVNFRDGSTIELKISNIIQFKTKSNDSVNEALLSDIKSFSAFLTTNPNDPFATGSNPFGDGFIISTNTITNNIIRFPNVPIGGPYYAVATAFDDISTSLTKNNISEPNISLISTDNKWWISNNTVNVLPSNRVVYSDSSTALNIDLILRKPIPSSISSNINISDGTTSNIQTPININ